MRLWAALYIALSFADLWLTYLGLSAGYSEVNPFAAAAWAAIGLFGLVLYKTTTVTVLLVLVVPLWRRLMARWFGIAALAVLGYTVYHNLVTIW